MGSRPPPSAPEPAPGDRGCAGRPWRRPVVPDIERAQPGESRHVAPVGAGRGVRRFGLLPGCDPRHPPDHDRAGRQAFEVPLPGPGRGLVEVVHVEQQTSLRRGEDPEVRHVGVAAQLHVQAARRGAGQVGRHDDGRAPHEGEGRLEHPPPAHRHEGGNAAPRSRRRAGRWDRAGPTRAPTPAWLVRGTTVRRRRPVRRSRSLGVSGIRVVAPSPAWCLRNDTGRRPARDWRRGRCRPVLRRPAEGGTSRRARGPAWAGRTGTPGRSRSRGATRASSWRSVSTPSAITCRPRAWASLTTAATISAPPRSTPSSSTKLLSILRMSSGNRWRWLSEEYPVPKSSMARVTPSSLSARSTRSAEAASFMSALSVISRVRLAGRQARCRRGCAPRSRRCRGGRSVGPRGSPRPRPGAHRSGRHATCTAGGRPRAAPRRRWG